MEFERKIKMMKKLMMAVAGVCAMLWAGTVAAETASYYDLISGETKYVDTVEVTESTSTFEDGKWYVVKGIVERGTITVNGSANLILTDGASLTVNGGIRVEGDNKLNIYAQNGGTGALIAKGSSRCAGIGGSGDGAGGTVTINGGTVTAQGGNNGAGIGGGDEGAGGDVTINGGRVSALGGGAGVGIGKGNLGASGKTRIGGGTVEARSGETWPDHPFGNSTVIDGGSVMAVDYNGEPAVTNSANAAVYCVTVEIETMNVEKLRVEGLADYGTQDIYPINGKVYLWLPNGEYLLSVNDQWYEADVNGAATVATPTRRPAFVTVTSAKQRWPWNGKVDVGYALSNIDKGKHYRLITAVTVGGTTRQVTNEVGEAIGTITVDCDALFGPGVLAPASVTMAVMATPPSLQGLIDAAPRDGVVEIPSGTYGPATVPAYKGAMALKPVAGAKVTIDGGGSGRCLTVYSSGVTLKGLTFANGRTDDGDGGGVLCGEGVKSVTVTDCTFANCFAAAHGGGVAGAYEISGCRFLGNRAGSCGGGVYKVDTVRCSLFEGNGAVTDGAAAYDSGLSSCTLVSNTGGKPVAGGSVAYSVFVGDDIVDGTGNLATDESFFRTGTRQPTRDAAMAHLIGDDEYVEMAAITEWTGPDGRKLVFMAGDEKAMTVGAYAPPDALTLSSVAAKASLGIGAQSGTTATKPNWAANAVTFTLDTLAERTIDLSAGVTITNLTYSGTSWGEPGAGTEATISYKIDEGDETTLAGGLTGTGETEWMLCTNATFVLTHTSGTATETATITLANLPMVTITVGDLAAKHLTGKVVWNGVETPVTGVSFKLPKGGTGAKLVLTAEQGFRLQSGYGVTIDLDDYLATGAPVSVDIEGAAAFSRVATEQVIFLDEGWHAIHIQVAETNDVDTLFRDWPVEWVALYDPSEPLSSYGSDEGTSRAGYRMWRRSEPGLSQFHYVPADSMLVCYASGPHICTFRGEPCAPRISWHKSDFENNLNLVGFSTWDETTDKSYFSGLDVGDAVFYQFGGDNADKPMVMPMMIAGALTFDNAQVLAVSSTKVSDWSGVLNVSPRNGLDFGTNARNRTLEVRNDGASRTVVTVKMKSDGVSYSNCDPMPQCLVVRDSFDAITNGPWTAFGLGTTLRRELLPGETWKIAFSIDILRLEEGKFYGAILDIRDETPDGSNMRVNVPLKAVRTGEVSSGSVELLGVTNRYPWNGKIDVAASVTDLDPTRYYRLVTSVTLGGTTKRVGRELGLGRDATFMNTVDCAALFGSNAVGQASVSLSLKAYAAAESPVDVVSDGTPQLMEGEYLIIDLTKTGSESYEETTLGEYLADHRDAWTLGGGWADIYKTRYLVMRKVPRWKKYPCEPRSVGMTTQTMIPKRDYWIGVHQVTKAQYERVMNGSESDSDDAKPKTDISWNDIRGDADILTGITNEVCFMRRLCRRTGLAGFDLPTEVQWEIAARAGSREPYGAYVDANGYLRTATAGDLTSIAWYAANSLDVSGIGAVKKVAQLRPNLWGLYDTAGNVSEWCRDGFGSFDRQDVETPSAESSFNSGFRVVRGGFCGGTADFCRPSVRSSASADSGSLYVGFRVMGVCEREDPNGDVENE